VKPFNTSYQRWGWGDVPFIKETPDVFIIGFMEHKVSQVFKATD
jgi:hypothetical protein